MHYNLQLSACIGNKVFNSLFLAAMIVTSFFSLTDLGVPMATVLKNLTNLFTIIGDWWLYGHVYGWGVWTALALVAASAFCGAATDIEFNAHGYAWQLVNCLLTAAYSLHLRGVIDKVCAASLVAPAYPYYFQTLELKLWCLWDRLQHSHQMDNV